MILEKHNLTKKYESLFNKFNVNTQLRLSHFFGQCQHESGMKPKSENLRYSAKNLYDVFRKYFPTPEIRAKYQFNAEMVANRAYANRNGNGNEASGDGWRFRGRGFIQLTGRNNYQALTIWAQKNGFSVDYVKNPDLLLNEADALIGALWFWSTNNINKYADKDDIWSISRIINLGNPNSKRTPNGMTDRQNQTNYFKRIFVC